MVYDVVIIGAGVIGGMLARELSRYAISVCILEKENDVAMGASRANSGIIHGGHDPIPGTLKAQLNTLGVEPLFQAAKELNVPCLRNGSLVCGFSRADEAHLEQLYRRGVENGVPGLKIISGDEARLLEPELSKEVTRALLVPHSGIIGPYELTIAAIGNAMDNGVALLRNFRVSGITKHNEAFAIRSDDGQQVRCRYVVNCAGCYADRIAQMAGDCDFEIIPRAGEYILLDKSEGTRIKHTLFQCPTAEGKGILVTPTVHGNLLTGPTAAKVPSPECRDTTPAGMARVKLFAAKSVPNIDFRKQITAFSGIRSSEAGGDFILRASEKVPGLIHAAAIDSPGLTCCVSIAKYITDILRHCGLALDEKPDWCGSRPSQSEFHNMTDGEKNAFIQKNPAYGKIVCRCEMVSEGEILAAIRANPPALDMDSVKRRTRSGMGRCQGGFCAPYVMKLIAGELGIPVEEVTKSGKDSRMVLGRVGEEP